MKGSIEIGQFLLRNFFDDNIELASSKSPKKPFNYQLLCRHEDLGVHPSTLGVMVRVGAQEKLFENEGIDMEKLKYSHRAERNKAT